MARKPFTMRSGNKTSFKMMGSSPMKELVGKQKNIDMNNNNRIDAEDFKILNSQKASPAKYLPAILRGAGALISRAATGNVGRQIGKKAGKIIKRFRKGPEKKQTAKKVDKRKSKETIFKEGEKNKPTLLDKTKYAVGGIADFQYGKGIVNTIQNMFTQETTNKPPLINKDYNPEPKKNEADKFFIKSD